MSRSCDCMKEINDELHTKHQVTLQIGVAGCLICWLSNCTHGGAAQQSVTWKDDSRAVRGWFQSEAMNSKRQTGSRDIVILILLTFLSLYGHSISNSRSNSAQGCIRPWQRYVKKKKLGRSLNTKTDRGGDVHISEQGMHQCNWNKKRHHLRATLGISWVPLGVTF